MPTFPLSGIAIIFVSAFVGGFLAKKLKQPLILGYLLAGLLVSLLAGFLGLDKRALSSLSELGLAFLMFTIGLEFSFKKLEKIRRVVVGGSLSQIGLTIALGTGLLNLLFKFDLRSALILSCAFSLSSTAVVFKILAEKGQSESLSGEIMSGWLLVQDLAVIPMIAVFPAVFNQGNFVINLLSLIKALAVVGLSWICAKRVIPKLTDYITQFGNREILLIFTVCLIFIFSSFTQALGFSIGLGAFLVGLILSQATANFAVFSEIRPLKDVFLAVFFVSLGFTLDVQLLFVNLGNIALITFAILCLKIVIVAFILLFFGYHAKVVFSCSFGLAQVGEFAFILVSTAYGAGWLGQQQYNLVVLITLLTMVLTPWFFSMARFFYLKADRLSNKSPRLKHFFTDIDKTVQISELPFENHAVILGYGRVGKWIGIGLKKSKIPYLVVDYNQDIVRELKLQEEKVIFGDPADIDVLDFAQVDRAKLVVLAIPDSDIAKIVVANCQTLNPRIKIICRSHIEEDRVQLQLMGVDDIIQPEFEAALSMAHRAMQHFGLNKEEISEKIKEIKREHGS